MIRLFLGDSPYGHNNHSTKIATFPLFVLPCAVTVRVYVSLCVWVCVCLRVFGGRGGPASPAAGILIECVWKPDFWFGLKLKCQILIIDNIHSLLHRRKSNCKNCRQLHGRNTLTVNDVVRRSCWIMCL